MSFKVYKTNLLRERIKLIRICDSAEDANEFMELGFMLDCKRSHYMVVDAGDYVINFKYTG